MIGKAVIRIGVSGVRHEPCLAAAQPADRPAQLAGREPRQPALALLIGAGGLGDPIAAGLALSDTRMILSGAIPAALLALGVDGLLGAVERVVRPGG